MPKALITGITGQDGSYLAEFLISKGYEVHGLIRKSSTFNTERIDHIYRDPHDPEAKLSLYYGDLNNSEQLTNLIYNVRPDEIYHMGAQSHVQVSFDMPEYTGEVTGLGTTRILSAVKRSGIQTRFYQASSSEMFGNSPHPRRLSTLSQGPAGRLTGFRASCIFLRAGHPGSRNAGIAQLVEHDLAKVGVASSSLVSRSKKAHDPNPL